METYPNYKCLFDTPESKAAAFDRIMANYYDKNFGRMSKADFELLLFDIYLEKILENSSDDFSAYSDYKLAKDLGITQSKVSSLKVKKQLIYPHEYKWRDALAKISDNVRFENGKFKLQIPDINLYYEVILISNKNIQQSSYDG